MARKTNPEDSIPAELSDQNAAKDALGQYVRAAAVLRENGW
jgi:hypothetical protein